MIDELLSRLDRVKQNGRGRWIARCPAHPDKNPSLNVKEEANGLILIHCFSGCTPESVLGSVGLDWNAVFPEKSIEHARPVRRPWRISDVIRALNHELDVAWVILADVAKGKEISDADRKRAADACERIHLFQRYLTDVA